MKYVLYHASCNDGSGAAMAAHSALGESGTSYIPVQYGKPIPQIADGSEVYILDFSYPRDVLEELNQRSSKLIVLDHHKTAAEALAGLSYATFDLEKSGARLAWEYFHPGKEIPDIILDIEDRDIWRHARPNSDAVSAALGLLPSFREYEKYTESTEELVETGNLKLKFDAIEIGSLYRKVTYGDWRLAYGDKYRVGIINTGQHISNLGEMIYRREDVDIAIMCFITEDANMVFSLRSNKVDVSMVARRFGGGGHPGAAGFKLPLIGGAEMVKEIMKGKYL